MDADDPTIFQAADRTILMPRPGGEATLVPARTTASARTRPDGDLQRLVAGVNPLLGAAAVPLALAGQLRATVSHADPARLRAQLLERIAEFEALAAANGVPRHQVGAARYLLCTFLDEVIEATPWGADSAWVERSLLQEFHDERSGADKAFKLLERLGEDPAANADLLQLFYVCLALGFEGRYRGQPNGRAQLEAISERVLAVTQTPEAKAEAHTLSPQWQGVATEGNRDLRVLPLWALCATCGALLVGLFLLLNGRLDAMAGPVFRELHGVPVALRVERAPAAARARLAPVLAADAAAGAASVRDEAQRSVVVLPADTLFVPGSARVEPGKAELLARIAQAVRDRGEVVVSGHTDDVAPRSLQYPSNWHLSRERADAVAALLARHGARADRLRAEGRADAEPLAAGTRPEDRARNRRIEIEWRLPRPEG